MKLPNEIMSDPAYKSVQDMLALLKARACGRDVEPHAYLDLRTCLIGPDVSPYLPSWLTGIRDIDQFWDYIQPKFGTYRDRRAYLDKEFDAIFRHLEFGNEGSVQHSPPSVVVSDSSVPAIKKRVFVVHGHDNESKLEVARYIESLGLEAVVLHEQVNGGMTIIEKNRTLLNQL